MKKTARPAPKSTYLVKRKPQKEGIGKLTSQMDDDNRINLIAPTIKYVSFLLFNFYC